MNEFIKDFGLLINAMLIATPPLLYAALGSCISERSGVVNIGIEGMMTVGAFTGAALCYFIPGSPWLAFVLAGVAGALVAVIHAFACITCNADQTISGTAINFWHLVLQFLSVVYYSQTVLIHRQLLMTQAVFRSFLTVYFRQVPSGIMY